MKNIKNFSEFLGENEHSPKVRLVWSIEDISGDCSPSGSTTLDSGNESFETRDEAEIRKQELEEEVEHDYRKARLYAEIEEDEL
jgi:hypothetical protein